MDHQNTLILSLSALLRAERETRFAMEAAIGAGVLDPEVLRAMLSDPVPVITHEDIDFAESLAMNGANPMEIM